MTDTGSAASYLVTVGIAVISSGGLQWVLTRAKRKRQDAIDKRDDQKQVTRDHEESERREFERYEALAQARAIEQRSALESAATRYHELERDYEKSRGFLSNLSHASAVMIDAFENIMYRLLPAAEPEKYTVVLDLSEVGDMRRKINEARRHLH